MQAPIVNTANIIATDASSVSGRAQGGNDVSGRGDFSKLLSSDRSRDRSADESNAQKGASQSEDVTETKAVTKQEDPSKESDNKRVDNNSQKENTVRADARSEKSSKDDSGSEENDQQTGLVGLSTDESAANDLSPLAEEGLFPDVTAIMPETSSSVQPASETNLLANSQSIGLISLAAQMEKTMAALQNQTGQKPATDTLAMLAGPQSPVLTDVAEDGQPMPGVTPLLDVLKTPSTETLPQSLPAETTNADVIIAAVKQVAKPVVDGSQAQLNVTVEETISPEQLMQDMAQPGVASKALQKLLDKTGGKGEKSSDDLLASLQQLIQGRAGKESTPVTAALGQTSVQAITGSDLSTDLGSDDFNFQNGQNQALNLMGATDHLRQANHTDSSFARMLHQSTSYTPVADQVLVHIKTAVSDGNSLIKIELKPAELGRVDVRMDVGIDGKTTMMITADNKDTLEMLQREARNLENALRDLGLKTDTGGLSFQLRNQNQEQQKFTRTGTAYASVEEIEEAPLQPITNSYSLQVQDGVDIRV
jgi:flagellar hook-length control protein FliK